MKTPDFLIEVWENPLSKEKLFHVLNSSKMLLSYLFVLIYSLFQIQVVGEYQSKGKSNSVGGSFKYISTLKLNKDQTYIYEDTSFRPSGELLDSDTVSGNWYMDGDTLFTINYKVKWLIRNNKLIKLSAGKSIKYKKVWGDYYWNSIILRIGTII